MRILGIDPGYDRLGIAIIDFDAKTKKNTLLYSECFETNRKKDILFRLADIGEKVRTAIETFEPKALAIETLFLANNQKTAMRVSEARGIIIYEAIKNGLTVREFSPMNIKMAVTGDGRADKGMMMKMVPLLVKMDTKKAILDDEYDAIAVALTYAATNTTGVIHK